MISLKLRYIREQNRIFKKLLNLLNGVFDGPVVYLFHDIVEDKKDVISQFVLSKDTFQKFLESKINSGHIPFNDVELLEFVETGKGLNEKSFLITFDDCNESVFHIAYPILKRLNIPFVLFITEELIGKKNFLNISQIKTMCESELCIIGSHGINHKMFRYFSKDELEKQYVKSKLFLEKLTNKKINMFAFPYGRIVEVSGKSINLLKRSVYSAGFSAISGNLNARMFTSNFFLPRINVDEKYASKNIKKL